MRPVAPQRGLTARAWTALVAIGATFAIAIGRHEPAVTAVAVPFLLMTISAGMRARWPRTNAKIAPARQEAVEGDVIDLEIEIESVTGAEWLDVEFEPPRNGRMRAAAETRLITLLPPGTRRTLKIPVKLPEWGVVQGGRIQILSRDRWGFIEARETVTASEIVKVHLPEERLLTVLGPHWFRPQAGGHVASLKGSGCELADVRPWRPGDPLKWINWRISARRQETWINERHPDRGADVILFVDGFTELGENIETTMRRLLRATRALAKSHLGIHDRVGMIGHGTDVKWVSPRLGRNQLHRIVDALLTIDAAALDPRTHRARIPVNEIPPRALVVALSPLLDPRFVATIKQLQAADRRLVVLDCEADELLPKPIDDLDRWAHRLLRIDLEVTRRRLRQDGIPVAPFGDNRPLDAAVSMLTRQSTQRTWSAR